MIINDRPDLPLIEYLFKASISLTFLKVVYVSGPEAGVQFSGFTPHPKSEGKSVFIAVFHDDILGQSIEHSLL